MTIKELNRDIKRLARNISKKSTEPSNDLYFKYISGEAKKEFMRLYGADQDFTAMNRDSILIMLRLNIAHRFVPLHTFGLLIELTELI